MIKVTCIDVCAKIMEEVGVTLEMASDAVNNSTAGLSDDGITRLAVIHWREDGRIIFVDSELTKFEKQRLPGERTTAYKPLAVTAKVVLALRPTLPGGELRRDQDMETVLAIVAESFGVPWRFHHDEPYSTLYSGPATFDDNGTPAFQLGPGDPRKVSLIGQLSACADDKYVELAWALDQERYREWFRTTGRAS